MMAESEKQAEKQRLKDMDSKDLRNATTEDKARAAPRADFTLAALAAPSPLPAPPRRFGRGPWLRSRRGGSRLQVARLDQLLSKSVAYSEFLANKIKKERSPAPPLLLP